MERIDVREESCPIPLVYTKKKLEEMDSGEEIEILADDPTVKRLPEWAKKHGHIFIKLEEKGEYFRIVLRKGQHRTTHISEYRNKSERKC